jgi:dolichyl-phosphate-mannose-protein mannosyltransferase
MSTRQRETAGSKKRGTTPLPNGDSNVTDALLNGDVNQAAAKAKQVGKDAVQKDWDYKLALGVITVLAFVTRFWGISHPNQVVFDEVHFGKVRTPHAKSTRRPRGGR